MIDVVANRELERTELDRRLRRVLAERRASPVKMTWYR